MNYVITAVTIPMFLCMRAKPEFPPSRVALKVPETPNFFAGVKQALTDWNFVVLMFVFMFNNGTFVALGSTIADIYGSEKLHGGPFTPS